MIKTTLAFATGCILILVLPTLPAIDWFWMVILNILLFILKPTRYLAIILIAALWTAWYSQTRLEQQLEPGLIQQTITLTGIIDSIPKKQHRTLCFNITTADNQNITLPKKISLVPSLSRQSSRWPALATRCQTQTTPWHGESRWFRLRIMVIFNRVLAQQAT